MTTCWSSGLLKIACPSLLSLRAFIAESEKGELPSAQAYVVVNVLALSYLNVRSSRQCVGTRRVHICRSGNMRMEDMVVRGRARHN